MSAAFSLLFGVSSLCSVTCSHRPHITVARHRLAADVGGRSRIATVHAPSLSSRPSERRESEYKLTNWQRDLPDTQTQDAIPRKVFMKVHPDKAMLKDEVKVGALLRPERPLSLSNSNGYTGHWGAL